jgi:hypothetical protein
MSLDYRLQRAVARLKSAGVGYRVNYGGPFESKYPHSAYHFRIVPDRDGTEIQIANMAGDGSYDVIGFAAKRDDMAEELVSALEAAALTVQDIGEG